MTAGNLQGGHLPFGEVVGLLRLRDAGGGLERNAEHQRVAVGDTAVHAAGVIGDGRHQPVAVVAAAAAFVMASAAALMVIATVAATFSVLFTMAAATVLALIVAALVLMAAAILRPDRGVHVVVLRASHPAGGKPVAEFYAADAGNGEDGMRETGFHAVPERLTEPGGDTAHDTFDDASQRIAILLRLVQGGLPFRLVSDSADFDETGVAAELNAAAGGAGDGREKQFLRDDTGGDDRERETAGEMAAAARVLEATVLEVRSVVRMAGTLDVQQGFVVLTVRVRIVENDGERSARRVAFLNAAEDVRFIRLHARSRAFRTAPAAGNVRRKVLLAERDARSQAVHNHSDLLSVRLAEDAYPEYLTECIHSLSNKSLKPGKDLATQALSSMSTGPSAPSAATLRAITMR